MAASTGETNLVVALLGAGGLTAIVTMIAQAMTSRGNRTQSTIELQARQWQELVTAFQRGQDDCLRRELLLRQMIDDLHVRIDKLENRESSSEVDNDDI